MNQEILEQINKNLDANNKVLLSGLSGSARSFVIQEVFRHGPGRLLYIAPEEERAYDLARELQQLLGREKVALFMERDFVFKSENPTPSAMDRIAALTDLVMHPRRKTIIITTVGALLFCIMSPAQMQKATRSLVLGQDVALHDLIRDLVGSGYERVDTVTRSGQLALRGGIFDIFPAGAREPYRADFFGDTVDSLRRFDINSQRSGEKVEQVVISPADEIAGAGLTSSLLDYLPPDSRIFLDEPGEIYNALDRQSRRYREFIKEARKEDNRRAELVLLDRERLDTSLDQHPLVYHSFFPGNPAQLRPAFYAHISQIEMEPFYHQPETLFNRIADWLAHDYTVRIAVRSSALRDEISRELTDRHLAGVEFVKSDYPRGFISQTLRLALITDHDIWGKKSMRRTRSRPPIEQRVLVEDLQRGDFVVHEHYGIGIFRGVTQVETDGVTREYILLQYAGTDKLYLPVDKLDLLHKYSGDAEREPRLSKLGGSEWERTRLKVTHSIQEMANELLRLYTERATTPGHAFPPDTPWQAQFEDEFPYQETPDQLKAIQEVKRDMESPRPMDRLVCGDVGYGKTEVALRAAFKAFMDSTQVAILVPTTVLAEQHYDTFRKRFKDFPAHIEVLSRFRSPAEQKKIVADVSRGAVDIVIATHRLLSKDIKFKNLGLLVVDEEHRFGVAQKEKIKALKAQVDVLSLSATPIPRSLHMGLTGLRDLSIIETPPPGRYPITTFVMEYNPEIVREAVLAEVGRNGQVFVVHNRIQGIYRFGEELQKLLPGVRICIGHGRMNEEELSRTMLQFIKGDYDVFLCTTIIESGLDMPNVNTIIIDMADRMGLAQLYQLRGRVGRSNRVAYAYLTYHRDKVITEASQKRLNAIREFNELGAGIRIALRDLEIRGAGNILGAEQHGYIRAVGFDLYGRLLEQEAAKLKGQVMSEPLKPQLDMDIDYFIPDSYIPDAGSKMRIYRRLLLADKQEEIESVREEIQDRFGPLPAPVENFLQVAALRLKARDKQIKGLRRKGNEIEIHLVSPLPSEYRPPAGLQLKKINPQTLSLRLNQAQTQSLKDLQELLDRI
ncbi:MAG: transcription-repair coupling factor [Syntrophomonadaceae bacterium]|nr:transcription-repair coupling factor [Syntrophomonadaceae bacterium]